MQGPTWLGNPLSDGLEAGKVAGNGEEFALLGPEGPASASVAPRPRGWVEHVVRKVCAPVEAARLRRLGYGEEACSLADKGKSEALGMLAPAIPVRFELEGSYEGTGAQAAIAAFLPPADPQEGLAHGGLSSRGGEGRAPSASLYSRRAAEASKPPVEAGALEAELGRMPALPGEASSSSAPGAEAASGGGGAGAHAKSVSTGSGEAQGEPKGGGQISSFEQAGDVAHVNLVQTHFPWRFAIGRVLLDL